MKNPRKFQSDNSRMKKDMQVVFQALLEKLISVIYYENPNPQNLLLALESQKKNGALQKCSRDKDVKYKNCFPELFFILEFNSSGKTCHLFKFLSNVAFLFTQFFLYLSFF